MWNCRAFELRNSELVAQTFYPNYGPRPVVCVLYSVRLSSNSSLFLWQRFWHTPCPKEETSLSQFDTNYLYNTNFDSMGKQRFSEIVNLDRDKNGKIDNRRLMTFPKTTSRGNCLTTNYGLRQEFFFVHANSILTEKENSFSTILKSYRIHCKHLGTKRRSDMIADVGN